MKKTLNTPSAHMKAGARRPAARRSIVAAVACLMPALPAAAQQQTAAPPLQALPSLNVPAYMGTWHQVAWFPNRFQKQCVSDTSATYRQLPSGEVEVANRCRLENGSLDGVIGLARPDGASLRGTQLEPAQLEVSFLPSWLRWVPIWGRYWVLDLAPDGRYAVISEPSREYLWVLARQPTLTAADETAIRSRLVAVGFDLTRWQAHPHTLGSQAKPEALLPTPSTQLATPQQQPR